MSTATLAFFRDVQGVRAQLARSEGLVGYALRARPLRREYWTLSVWESERALLAFVKEQPHGGIMGSLRGRMGATKFVRWRVGAADPLPGWEDAMRRAAADAQRGLGAATQTAIDVPDRLPDGPAPLRLVVRHHSELLGEVDRVEHRQRRLSRTPASPTRCASSPGGSLRLRAPADRIDLSAR
jgi:heme-degrading monooxygenase HmoA